MKTRLLRRWFRECGDDIKKCPFITRMFSFRDEKDKTRNISNMSEKRLNVHVYAKVIWNWKSPKSLLNGKRTEFEYKYRKYRRKYWTPKAIMERDLEGIND